MAELKLGPPNVQDFQTRTAPTIRFSFFECGAVLDFLRSRNLQARLPMRGTSGSVRRSPANPARPGREQRYRDRFVRRGVPEVPLICSVQAFSVVLCESLRTPCRAFRISTQRAQRTQRRKSGKKASSNSMSYQVIARKWRPQRFADVVGQQHVTRTLSNAIQSGRVAHAYIFSGARGVGKTTTARILAKALNCVKGPAAEPCNECDSCREIGLGNSLDVIEIDAASNRGIDQIRELREMVRYAPAGGRYKVVILDEAHMLTGEASNALLKTLEEPPDKVIFVMATTEPESLVDTIRSRSQHFHFRALTFAEIAGRLEEIAQKENLKMEQGAMAVIARRAEGSLRDALSLLEQARAYCGDTIADKEVRELLGVVPEDALEELIGAISAGSADRALGLVHTFQKEGRNLQHFCREAIRHMRNLLIARTCGADSDLIAATPDQRPALEKAAALFSEEDLTRFFQILLQTDDDLRRKPDPRVHLEMSLLRLINASRLAPLEELLAELKSGAPGSVANTGMAKGASPAIASTSFTKNAAPSVVNAVSTPPKPETKAHFSSSFPTNASTPATVGAPVEAKQAVRADDSGFLPRAMARRCKRLEFRKSTLLKSR